MKRTCCGTKLHVKDVMIWNPERLIYIRMICLWCNKNYAFLKPNTSKTIARYLKLKKEYTALMSRANIPYPSYKEV